MFVHAGWAFTVTTHASNIFHNWYVPAFGLLGIFKLQSCNLILFIDFHQVVHDRVIAPLNQDMIPYKMLFHAPLQDIVSVHLLSIE